MLFLADRLREEVGAARVSAFVTSHVVFFLVHQAAHDAAADCAAGAVQAAWHGQIDVWPSIPAAVYHAHAPDGARWIVKRRW